MGLAGRDRWNTCASTLKISTNGQKKRKPLPCSGLGDSAGNPFGVDVHFGLTETASCPHQIKRVEEMFFYFKATGKTGCFALAHSRRSNTRINWPRRWMRLTKRPALDIANGNVQWAKQVCKANISRLLVPAEGNIRVALSSCYSNWAPKCQLWGPSLLNLFQGNRSKLQEFHERPSIESN